ncbi:MAG: SBBP repeat-containing protein [Thermodesulfobacteriota bacterium]
MKYYAAGSGHTFYFTREEIVLSLTHPGHVAEGETPGFLERGPGRRLTRQERPEGPAPVMASVVRVRPVGIKKNVKLKALQLQGCKVNYFIGNNPKKWRTDIPTYAGVLYEGAYPGIDLKFYGHGRELEYDVVVYPGADPGQVRFAYEGVEELRLTAEGHLALKLPGGGELIQKKPVVYQEIAGQRIAREARFAVQKGGARLLAGFEVASYDKKYPLVIDPVLIYSTYLGGHDYDEALGIAADAAGAAYITGCTSSSNFPITNALQGSKAGGQDVFVSKLTPAGNGLAYATYLGGSSDDYAYGIAVDASGAAYITGATYSSNFPTGANAPQKTFGGGSYDAFAAKISPGGNTLVFSTYLGGSGGDRANGIAVDPSGAAYIAGGTGSPNFPTTESAYQRTFGGGYNAFVVKLNPAGDSLAYSTFLGGSVADNANGIAVDVTGAAYVAGQASSPNFPTTANAYQKTFGGGYSDVFVAKISPAGTALVYSTYLGGSSDELGKGIAVDSAGAAYVTGFTYSSSFPTTPDTVQRTYGGGACDAFVAKLTAAGEGLTYSTYLGGSGQDIANGIALDSNGAAYITGYTSSNNFPTANAPQPAFGGARDAFLAELTQGGNAFAYSTYLGGGTWDWANGVALDTAGNAYIAGYTFGDFPTRSAFQYGYGGGGGDSFVAKIGDAPPPTGKGIVPAISLLLLLSDDE